MSPNNGAEEGIPKCYVFKSRLQEYAQKAGISTPVYETMKEGPSHEPSFRSTVVVDNVKYDSLPGFFNRKAAEQSAAEVALMELAKSGNLGERISIPVHESGLCKNLLQECAQKMNFAIPSYVCEKVNPAGKTSSFICTTDIGGIQYIGAAARTKKEAEIKAARTALLAIQGHGGGSEVRLNDNIQYTVVPCKKKGAESNNAPQETTKALKPKKNGFKKKWIKKKLRKNKGNETKLNHNEQALDTVVHEPVLKAEDTTMEEGDVTRLNQNVQATANAETESARKSEDTAVNMSTEKLGLQHVGSKLHQNAEFVSQAEDSGMLVVQANQNYQSASCGVSGPTDGNPDILGLLPAQVTAGVQVGNLGLLVADSTDNSQVAETVNLNSKQNGQGTSDIAILEAVQSEDRKEFVMEGNVISGSGLGTPMVTCLSTAPETPVVMDINTSAKDNGNGQ